MNEAAFWTAFFTALPPFLAALAAFIQSLMNAAAVRKNSAEVKQTLASQASAVSTQIADVHDGINGRMDQLVAQTALASHAQGVTDEKSRQESLPTTPKGQ